jgi:monovalent cation/hydrogen antiporter
VRRLRRAQAPAPVCEHLAAYVAARIPSAASDGCAECNAEGTSSWAHLRMCLECGHVGCCDSSPNQHATGHFQLTGHPVMRSIEPGETWRWCYVDNELLNEP